MQLRKLTKCSIPKFRLNLLQVGVWKGIITTLWRLIWKRQRKPDPTDEPDPTEETTETTGTDGNDTETDGNDTETEETEETDENNDKQ